mmetsp:Transcript_73530/g.186352  ORF Transcript_73530/g.186352 Transcript_73530/m.186352 type:complete len:277 (-) Transcript_73530:246-1076(-)
MIVRVRSSRPPAAPSLPITVSDLRPVARKFQHLRAVVAHGLDGLDRLLGHRAALAQPPHQDLHRFGHPRQHAPDDQRHHEQRRKCGATEHPRGRHEHAEVHCQAQHRTQKFQPTETDPKPERVHINDQRRNKLGAVVTGMEGKVLTQERFIQIAPDSARDANTGDPSNHFRNEVGGNSTRSCAQEKQHCSSQALGALLDRRIRCQTNAHRGNGSTSNAHELEHQRQEHRPPLRHSQPDQLHHGNGLQLLCTLLFAATSTQHLQREVFHDRPPCPNR